MLAFLEERFQWEWAVRAAWSERVGAYGFDAEKGEETDPGQAPHLISWEGFSAFWGLKMNVSCSSRYLSCSHVESLLQMKDSGHRLKNL